MSNLPMPPSTHPATATGLVPSDSIGPLPPHLADIGTPERQRSPVGAVAYVSRSGSPGVYAGSPSHTYNTASASASAAVHTYHTSVPPVSTGVRAGSPSYVPAAGSPSYVPTAGSPGFVPASGPTYEEEVRDFLDKTSPARIREQSPTTLPPAEYMNRASHESVTNENSPARQRSYAGSPPVGAMGSPLVASASPPPPVSGLGGGYIGTEYVPVVAGSPPLSVPLVSVPVVQSAAYSSPVGSPGGYVDTGSVVPPAGRSMPGEGESPRRLRAFGHPHTDPYNAGNQMAAQQRLDSLSHAA